MSTTVGSQAIETRNPATDEVLQRYEPHDHAAVDARLNAAVRAQRQWRAASFEERGRALKAAARSLRERKREHAELATREMSKPVAEAMAEIEKCAVACDWFAGNAQRLLTNEEAASSATRRRRR